MDNNKRIAKNTVALYVRMAFVMGVTLYTSRIVLEALGVDDYGLYNVIGGIVVLLSFLNGAMAITTQRFLSYEMGSGDSDSLRITFTQTLIVHTLIAILILIVAESVGLWFVTFKLVIPSGKETAAFWIYQTSVLSFIISVILAPFNSAIISNEKMSVYAYFSIFEVLGKLIIAWSLLKITHNRLIWYAVLIFIISVVTGIAYTIYCIVNFKECHPIRRFDKGIIRKLTSFAGWSLFGSIAWAAKGQGLNVLLNLFFGTAINAAYGVANQVNVAINSFVQNFSTAVSPQIVKTYSAGEYHKTIQLIYSGSRLSFLLLLIIAFPVFACINPILHLWLVKIPDFSTSFIRLIIIISLLESFTYPMGTAIQATGHIKTYQVIVGFTLLLTLPISWVCLKFGMEPDTVFFVSILVAVIALMIRLFILQKSVPYFSIRKFARHVLFPSSILLILCGVTILVGLFINQDIDKSSIIQFPIYLLLGCLFVWVIGLNSTERHKIYTLIRNKLQN